LPRNMAATKKEDRCRQSGPARGFDLQVALAEAEAGLAAEEALDDDLVAGGDSGGLALRNLPAPVAEADRPRERPRAAGSPLRSRAPGGGLTWLRETLRIDPGREPRPRSPAEASLATWILMSRWTTLSLTSLARFRR